MKTKSILKALRYTMMLEQYHCVVSIGRVYGVWHLYWYSQIQFVITNWDK